MTGYVRTPQQLAIIAHPLEPLRVAAGAGTGKTATVTDRLVAVIRDGVPPEAALGITFTNKAAEELGERLRGSLHDFAAEGREVEVTTYHGFAFRLLQEFGAFVGVERATAIIGPGYVRQLLFESLEGGDYAHLDLAAAPQRVAEAATLAAQLGDNLRSAADLLACDEADDPWPARRELAGIVARYEQLKHRLGVVDYPDLIKHAHRLVHDHPDVAGRVRARYRIVVLDEYQDTAPAQRELLRLVFGDGFPITAVGDTDQTIYEWRGASAANFDAFPSHFPSGDGTPAPTLPLSVNHRSGSAILDVAHAVRTRLHPEGSLVRLEPEPSAPAGAVTARWFRTATDEAVWIAGEILRLHDEEGVRWADMSVLFRKNRQIGLVRDACAIAGVPIEVASLGGLLEVPEVADLVAWLSVLHRRDDTVSLARILLGSRYRLGLGDLAHLERWARRRGLWADDEEGPSWPLLEAVDRLDEIEDVPDEARRRLAEFRDLYRSLLTTAQSLSLVELCRAVLDAYEAWDEVEAMEPAAAVSARLNLYRFLDLAQEWSPLEGRPSLEAFLGYLDVLRADPAAEELDTARLSGSEAVALLTVHRAKGLEWDTVFLPGLAEGIFPARSLGHDNPAAHARFLPFAFRLDAGTLPDLDVPPAQRDAALRERHLAGEWRTAYVAVTRAGRRLGVSGASWYEGTRPRRPSVLYELVAACPSTEVESAAADPGERPDRLAVADAPAAPDPDFPDGWAAAMREAIAAPDAPARSAVDREAYDAGVHQLRLLVDGLPREQATPAGEDGGRGLSVTGLVTLASCPLRFYWSEIDPLPRRPTDALRRGIELHRKIELHNRGAIAFDDLDDDLYDVPERSDEGRPGGGFGSFLRSRFAGLTPRFVETPIDLKVGPARIRGRIDAVYEHAPGSWEIVDYKSGRSRNDPAADVQLEAYAVAAREGAVSVDRPADITVTFLYLGGDEPEEVTHVADDAWLEEASRHLRDLVDRAGGEEFAASPSPACAHCDFVRFCEPGTAYLADA